MTTRTIKSDSVKKFNFHINNLVILGGPSAAGKSTLASEIQQGHLPNLCNLLGIHPHSKPIYIDVEKLQKQATPQVIDQLILHYDFLHQLLPGPDFRHLSEIINLSENTTALTLCIPSKPLVTRLSSRLRNTSISLIKEPKLFFLRKAKTLWNKKKYLEKNSNTITLYKNWFAFLEKNEISSSLISNNIDSETTTCIPYNWNAVERMLDNQ